LQSRATFQSSAACFTAARPPPIAWRDFEIAWRNPEIARRDLEIARRDPERTWGRLYAFHSAMMSASCLNGIGPNTARSTAVWIIPVHPLG
jgi:hypothetical protein